MHPVLIPSNDNRMLESMPCLPVVCDTRGVCQPSLMECSWPKSITSNSTCENTYVGNTVRYQV